MAKAINFGRKEGSNQYNARGGSHTVNSKRLLPMRAPKYSSSSSDPTGIRKHVGLVVRSRSRTEPSPQDASRTDAPTLKPIKGDDGMTKDDRVLTTETACWTPGDGISGTSVAGGDCVSAAVPLDMFPGDGEGGTGVP